MYSRFLMSLPAFFGKFFSFIFYAIVFGMASFYLGELLPRKNFNYDAYPFKPQCWERDGRIYRFLRIARWKDKVPDMSQYVKRLMRKRIVVFRDAEYLDLLVRETCVAEFTHLMLILLSPVFLLLIDGWLGWLFMILYVIIGNMPFLLIQRFNRPRLLQLMRRQEQRNAKARFNASTREGIRQTI